MGGWYSDRFCGGLEGMLSLLMTMGCCTLECFEPPGEDGIWGPGSDSDTRFLLEGAVTVSFELSDVISSDTVSSLRNDGSDAVGTESCNSVSIDGPWSAPERCFRPSSPREPPVDLGFSQLGIGPSGLALWPIDFDDSVERFDFEDKRSLTFAAP